MFQVGRTLFIRIGTRARKQISLARAQQRRNDILEDVPFDHVVAGGDIEGVAGVCVPVVVYGVEKRVASNFGRLAGDVVDVVVFEGYQIVGAGQVECPVVVVVTGG